MYDYWDSYSNTVITSEIVSSLVVGTEFPTKVTLISNRWLVLSYQVNQQNIGFSHALVFDIALKRWGKLKQDHVDCFSFNSPDLTAKEQLGLLKILGKLYAA